MDFQNRRAFLRAAVAASVAWAAADLQEVEAALDWAHQATGAPGPRPEFKALTPAQGDVVDAMASRILPSVDGRPGAHDAGAVYFIDRALSTFNGGQKKLYAAGIADLNRRAASLAKGSGFTGLDPAKQDEVLRAIEKTPFFQTVRFDAIVGTFALPTWGANRDYAGWHMIGFDHQPRFQPPFGFYDADANRRS